jgi:insulysin
MTTIALEQPSLDKRKYLHVTLDDELDVLLISDPETDKASAAMDVHVGQLCDGDFPGIAHFCEHMLFIGTEKYPTENAYDQFLTTHGGSSNAFTDLEHTCYYFDVQAGDLEGAFDRFAQCFIGPLFTQSALEREVLAVDSEHNKNLQQDTWRLYQLSKTALADSHAYASFGSGNQESLPIANIREALLEFYDKYYRRSLSLYKLVVLGKESLEELEAMVRKYFQDLTNAMKTPETAIPRDEMLQQMFQPVVKWNVPQRLHVVPVGQVHAIELQFPMPPQLTRWQSKPTRYLSHLIGHEGQGSLLSLLKEKDYALELYADDASKSCIPWNIMTIRIELTDLGLENVNEVVQILFSYIELLKTSGPQEWVQQELQIVSDLQFRFMSQRNPMDYTCSVAGWMQLYPPSHYLSGPYVVSQWEPDAVEECLACLNPDNVLWLLSSPTFAGQLTNPQTEKWYGTQYQRVELDDPLQNQLRTAMASDFPDLAFPQVNDMIATDFELLSTDLQKSVPLDKPQCIALTMGSTYKPEMQLWYKPDNVFEMPKVNVLLHFPSGVADATPLATVATQVFVEWVQEQVNEYTYLASMAGLHCDVSVAPGSCGIDLQVTGYHHKAHVLVEKLFSVILTSLQPSDKDDSELFGRLLYKLEQQFQAFLVSQPYQHAVYGADQVLEEGKFTVEHKLAALTQLDKASVVEHAIRFWKDCRMVALIHGNLAPQHAKDMVEKIWSNLGTFRGQQNAILSLPSERRVVQLADGTSYLYRFEEFNEANTNSCMQIILQIGAVSLKDNATLAFVHHLVREPAFNQLRTEEQLGYIVHTSIKTSGADIKGLVFLIQSDGFDPIHVESRVEEFLANFRPRIVEMTEEDFATHVNTVVASFLEKVSRFSSESMIRET